MFDGFADLWTPLVPAREVGRRPLRLVLAGEPLVAFRGPAGEMGVLLDRCPHRGAALSLGRVGAEGHLECPFHGWCFDTAGRNVRTPLNPDARRERLGVQALPVRVLGDFIWVYTNPAETAPPEPVAPDSLTAPDLVRTTIARTWACHWSRAMENMLDSPHLPFVHRRTIGRAYRRRMRPDSRMDIDWTETPWGGRASASLDGEASGAWLDFYRPNVMALTIPVPGQRLRIHALVVPEAPGRTRLFVVGSRDFARLRLLDPLFAWMNGRIADEDRKVVESSGPQEVPPAASERSVGTDQATLQFRRYYYDVLRGSAA
ncbi:MAG TPA: aromatic ring-hydroxylating dioxygenase subunit alpha [Caulobacteraceae bacterium]|nr:aromatic ring-hydroxylating dioxygenase subunit alpha [Caulobacteraceae bacterium]